LIRGESGVGKELVAGAIHHESPRRDGPLVCLNCAALSPTLLESELFGHEKGAFTGATEQKKGKFEAADGGTLMLDEIGEMDVNLQAKLLRVLEGHPFERLGGQVPLRVDVRLIAATNRDLAAEVSAGRFRGDLYYRLNVVEIVVPPLRERGDDLLKLADHFVRHFADKTARVVDGFTVAARQAITGHAWPGNVRELKNVIERAVVLGNDPLIDVADLGLPLTPVKKEGVESTLSIPATTHPGASGAGQEIVGRSDDTSPSGGTPDAIIRDPAPAPASVPAAIDPTLSLEEVERRHLVEVLRANEGNKSRAAAVLGIERSTLDRKLKRYGLNRGSGW
jgi:Nif-specific regulatory protein